MTIPGTTTGSMRAVTTDGAGGLVLARRPRPVLPPRGGLVRVLACGLCGSDIEKLGPRDTAAGTAVAPGGAAAGVVLGHEVVGMLERPGLPPVRVALAHHVPCGDCRLCRAGHSSLCARFVSTNLDPGGFAEYLAVSDLHLQDAVFELPAAVDDLTGTLLEPLSCVLRALDTAATLAGAFPPPGVRGPGAGDGAAFSATPASPAGRLPRPAAPGEPPNVLVAGCGSVGLLFVSVLARSAGGSGDGFAGARAPGAAAHRPASGADRGGSAPDVAPPSAEPVPSPYAGARVSYLEPDPERAALAEGLGAARHGAAGHAPIDLAFVTAPAALPEVVASMAPGGVVVAFAAGPEWSPTPLDLDAVYRGELTLVGVRSGSPAHLRRALALLAEGRLPLEWFRPLVVDLEELPAAVRRYREGGVLKVVARP